ncbi:MAG: hypothetical protein ACE5JS_18505, partial [Nitrospinota bacterium]
MVSEGWAQEIFQLGPWEGEITFDFDGSWRGSGDSRKSQDTRFEEGVRIRNRGYLLDPRIFNFSLEINPLFSQRSFQGPDREEEFSGRFLNYNAGIGLLQGRPVNLDAQATQTSGTTEGSLGARTEFQTDHRRVGVNFGARFFPSTISYSERSLEETFRSGLTSAVSQRDDVLRSLSFKGRSSKTNVSFEHLWFDDGISDRDFSSDSARLSHSFRWGKGSYLNSSFDNFKRVGFLPYERLGIDETARLLHTKRLYSTYSYRYSSLTQERETKSHSGSFALTHQLYQNLTTTFNVLGSLTDFEVGEEDIYGAGMDVSYRKKIPWGAQLSAGFGGAYRINDREAERALFQVLNEAHVIDSTLIVVLNQRFIDPASIVVTDAAGTIVFTEGTDYTLIRTDSL